MNKHNLQLKDDSTLSLIEQLRYYFDNSPYKHPIFGCMKGTVIVPDGVDLTEPAMSESEWAEIENAKYGPKSANSKYQPIEAHLVEVNTLEVHMTFQEIEVIIGFELPKSARQYRSWWSNHPKGGGMTQFWLAAGYKSERVNMTNECLVFVKDESRRLPDRPFPSAESKPFKPSFFG